MLKLVEPETAGDPMSKSKWLRSSLDKLSVQLKELGHQASAPTVGRLLVKNDYALRVHVKKKETSSQHPDRDQQFRYIEEQKQAFLKQGWPVISVDTKKKELIGAFKQSGQRWSQRPIEVNVHDFPSDAVGRAVPYGIYDLQQNKGAVYVGESADTPEFAVRVIAQWYAEHSPRGLSTGTALVAPGRCRGQ